MRTWAPLWSGIVASSLWDEPDHVVKVFMTMLALKDSDHVYRGDAYALSKESRKNELDVLEALKILASPDKRKISPQEFEGRRIQAVEDGWLILNGEKYRAQVQKEMKRLRNARAQKAYRERRQKLQHGGTFAERTFEQAEKNGDSETAARLLDLASGSSPQNGE